MGEFGLQSLLPRGMVTFESVQGRSTVDLVLASPHLERGLVRCQIHPIEHGSDHRAIASVCQINTLREDERPHRYLFRETDWEEVTTLISHLQGRPPTITSPHELEQHLDHLVGEVARVMHEVAPQAKPSPYKKRWWTRELTELRDVYNHARNQSVRARRYGYPRPELEEITRTLRQRYHLSIREQKRKHWKEFLGNVENIWKAARYLDTTDPAGSVFRILFMLTFY
jgi:hypothetical protein